MSYDTTALLTRVRLYAGLSGDEANYTDAVLLDLCTRALAEEISPKILARNGDYYLTYKDIAVTVGRNKYPIPYRATLGKIHSVYLLSSAKTSDLLLPLTDQRLVGIQTSGSPNRHTIVDNSIVLNELPSVTGYLRLYYPYTPSDLVATTACMVVTSRTAGKLNGTPPAAWTTGDRFDVISGVTPFEMIHSYFTASSVATGVTFTEADLDTDRLDDDCTFYVTLAGESCFPTIPRDLHFVLADLAACPVLHTMGDEGWKDRYATAHKSLDNLVNALIVRKETEHKPTINEFSFLEYFS